MQGPGQVVESNTIMAQVYLDAMGAHCTRLPITCDDKDLIREALRSAAAANDLVPYPAGIIDRSTRFHRRGDLIARDAALPWRRRQAR